MKLNPDAQHAGRPKPQQYLQHEVLNTNFDKNSGDNSHWDHGKLMNLRNQRQNLVVYEINSLINFRTATQHRRVDSRSTRVKFVVRVRTGPS